MSRSSLRSFWVLVAIHVALWIAIVLTLLPFDEKKDHAGLAVITCRVLQLTESMLLLVAAVWWPTSNWIIRALLLVLAAFLFHLENGELSYRPHEFRQFLLSAVTVLTPVLVMWWTGYRVRLWKPAGTKPSQTPWQFSIRQLLIWTTAVGILLGTRFGQSEPLFISLVFVATVWLACLMGLGQKALWWCCPIFFPWITLYGWLVFVEPISMLVPGAAVAILAAGPIEIAWLLLNVLWIRSLGYRLIWNTGGAPSQAAGDS